MFYHICTVLQWTGTGVFGQRGRCVVTSVAWVTSTMTEAVQTPLPCMVGDHVLDLGVRTNDASPDHVEVSLTSQRSHDMEMHRLSTHYC